MKSLSLSNPHLIVMVGIPGSGKTYFAKKFSEMFLAPFISYHHLQHLTGSDIDASNTAAGLLKEVMKTKKTILFEGATERRVERAELSKIARENGYKVLFVWVQTDPATTETRCYKVMTKEQYDTKIKRFSPPHESEPFIVISGKHTYGTQAKTLLKRLSEQARPDTPVNAAATSSVPPTIAVPPRPQTRSRIRID